MGHLPSVPVLGLGRGHLTHLGACSAPLVLAGGLGAPSCPEAGVWGWWDELSPAPRSGCKSRQATSLCVGTCGSVPPQLPHSCCLLSQLVGTWRLSPASLACPQSSATSCLFRAIQVPTSSSNKGRACAEGRCSPACPPAVPLTHSPALPTLRSSQKMLV